MTKTKEAREKLTAPAERVAATRTRKQRSSYGPDLRRKIIHWARECRARKFQGQAVAAALGMPYWTLWSWLRGNGRGRRRADRAAASIVRVAIDDLIPARQPVRSWVVSGPRGLTVSGLTIEELCALWQRLS